MPSSTIEKNEDGSIHLNNDGSTIVKIGSTTLVGGLKDVAFPSITSDMKVIVTNNGIGGTIGLLSVAVGEGVGFTITSVNILYTSTVVYMVVKP